MKFLTMFFLILSFNAFSNYMPESKIGTIEVITSFSDYKKCESFYGESCKKVPFKYSAEYYELSDIMINDLTKPIISKIETMSCSDISDCDLKFSTFSCSDSTYDEIKNYDLLELYCYKITGYEKKASGQREVSINQAKRDAYDLAQSSKDALESAMKIALRSINCGNRVKARLLVQNAPKGLSSAQRVLLSTTYAPIQSLLESGSLLPAREKILAVVSDGVLITDSDKNALVSELDSCKP